jgi:hypothetical protein
MLLTHLFETAEKSTVDPRDLKNPMAEQLNPEDLDDDWYDDEDEDLRLRSGDYVRDTQDGEHGEVFRMQGDPSERRVQILDRDGRGWYITPDRLTRVDSQDPDVQRYFGKHRQRDMDEAVDDLTPYEAGHADGLSAEPYENPYPESSTDHAEFRKGWRTGYAEKDLDEGWSDAMVARRTGQPRTPYSVYIKGRKWKDFENDDHARAVMDKLKAKFKADGRDPSVITIAPTDIPEGYDQEVDEVMDMPPDVPPAVIAPAPAAKYMAQKPQAPRAQANEPAPKHAKGSIYSDDETTLKVYKPEQYREEKTRLDPKCWTGKKIGNPKTKVKGGVRVNNCVPAESIEQGVTEAPIANTDDPMDPVIHGHEKANPMTLQGRIGQARNQLRDLARMADSNELATWEQITKLAQGGMFMGLEQNLEQIRHGIEELAKKRTKGGVASRGISKDIGR